MGIPKANDFWERQKKVATCPPRSLRINPLRNQEKRKAEGILHPAEEAIPFASARHCSLPWRIKACPREK